MWWQADPQDLHRLTDRMSTIYVERCHIDRDENAVVLVNRERTVRLPAVMVSTVLIGPGTRITHGAVCLLADSGTAMCWVGEHGVRMYASGLGVSRGTTLLLRQAWLVTRVRERLGVARAMYSMRFPGEDISTQTMQQLRGREGARVRRIYRENAERTGVQWNKREYVAGQAFEAGDDINRMLSAAHAALYGLCHAAIVGVGASPALGFVHTGSATSFVLDIADLYKAEYTIPLAFDLVAANRTDERDARLAFRDKVSDGHLLTQVIADVKQLLLADTLDIDLADTEAHELWDDELGAVPGGINWDKVATNVAAHSTPPTAQTPFVVVSGPEVPADWRVDE